MILKLHLHCIHIIQDFFKLFRDSSPISKVLCKGNQKHRDAPHVGEAHEDHLIPKFSLGLSQLTPKNLRMDIDGSADSPVTE